MQPLQYDLRSPAAKDNSITNAATAKSNLDATIYTAGTILQLQSTMEFHWQLIHQQHLQSHLHWGNDPRVANHNGIPSATHPPAPLTIPFTLRERSYSYKSQWNSVDRTCTKHRWNPIYNAEPIRPWSDHDPSMIRPHTRPSRTRRTAEVDHRGSGTDFVWRNIGFRASAIALKIAFRARLPSKLHPQLLHQHHLQCHLHCGNDPTVTNHNGILSTAHARNTGETPFTMRNRSDHDPTMIRAWSEHDPTTHETVSHPSHRRGRSSRFGDGLCMEKHRVSCICYLSKTHFVRDFLQNSIGNSSTSTTCNAICIAGTILQLQITMEFCRPHIHETQVKPHLQCGTDPTMIRAWSEHDPTTHETVSHPSHRRGRSSRFGDGLCMEKHRVSCICYLSKTHFVRDFLQNSIGNSSTSTTCNAICIAGTILQLQITMEFHRQLIHQHHLQSHLHCGNDPTVTNHNGILSTAHARNTGETPFTMRNRSDHDPTMIRAWSEHDPTTHETVSHPSHRRGRSSRFGDGLCMEKHRVSCICYLSKTHFVRDFLQKSNLKMSFTINSFPH